MSVCVSDIKAKAFFRDQKKKQKTQEIIFTLIINKHIFIIRICQ